MAWFPTDRTWISSHKAACHGFKLTKPGTHNLTKPHAMASNWPNLGLTISQSRMPWLQTDQTWDTISQSHMPWLQLTKPGTHNLTKPRALQTDQTWDTQSHKVACHGFKLTKLGTHNLTKPHAMASKKTKHGHRVTKGHGIASNWPNLEHTTVSHILTKLHGIASNWPNLDYTTVSHILTKLHGMAQTDQTWNTQQSLTFTLTVSHIHFNSLSHSLSVVFLTEPHGMTFKRPNVDNFVFRL